LNAASPEVSRLHQTAKQLLHANCLLPGAGSDQGTSWTGSSITAASVQLHPQHWHQSHTISSAFDPFFSDRHGPQMLSCVLEDFGSLSLARSHFI
jgi:hypothetical protein